MPSTDILLSNAQQLSNHLTCDRALCPVSCQVAALKNLNLNIKRAKLSTDDVTGAAKHKFFITDSKTADKVGSETESQHLYMIILCVVAEKTSGHL